MITRKIAFSDFKYVKLSPAIDSVPPVDGQLVESLIADVQSVIGEQTTAQLRYNVDNSTALPTLSPIAFGSIHRSGQ